MEYVGDFFTIIKMHDNKRKEELKERLNDNFGLYKDKKAK